MSRLGKYLKPYLLLILITIVLLFVQANAELALPDYLSKMVNNGIQQGGVENAVPEAIRQSQMDRLVIFMGDEDRALVLDSYLLVEPGSAEAEQYRAAYPGLADGAVYVLKEVDQATTDALNRIMGKALVVVSSIEQMIADPSKAAALGQGMGFDLSKLPPGTDLFALLKQLPPAQSAGISSAIEAKFAALGDSMITQMAAGAVKAEYEALGMDAARLQRSYIMRIGGLMLLVSLLAGVCTIAVGYLASKTSSGMARDIRKALFKRIESFSNVEFDKFSTASLITRSTNDVTQVQMVIGMIMRMVFYAPIIGIGGIIRALGKSANMWWIIALAVLVLVGLIAIVFSISLPKFKIMQSLIDRLNLVMRENLSGMMVIRAFNKQGDEAVRFDKANRDLTSTSLFVARVMVTLMPVMMLVMNGLSLGIIWVGAHQVAQSTMQVGDMMAFMQYAMQIVFAFLMLSMMFIFLPRAAVSGDRIADVLETEDLHHRSGRPAGIQGAVHRLDRVRACCLPLSRRSRRCAPRHQLHGQARRDHGLRRLYGLGQIDRRQPDPALLRCDRRFHLRGRDRHSPGQAERPARQDRLHTAEGHALLGHNREQLALCRPGRQPRDTAGSGGHCPGERVHPG